MFKKLSIQSRIIFLVCICVIFMFGILWLSTYLSVRESVERTLNERLILARATATHLEYILKQNLRSLSDIGFAQGVDLEDDNPEPEKQALHTAYYQSIFGEGVFLLDREGKLLLSAPEGMLEVVPDMSRYPYVRKALASGKPVVSNVYTIEAKRKNVISAVVPLTNSHGEVVGLAGGNMDPTAGDIVEAIRSIKLGETGYIEVVDGNGIILASTRIPRLFTPTDHKDFLRHLIEEKRSTVSTCHSCHQGEEKNAERETELLAFNPLPSIPWGIAVRQSEAEAFGPTQRMKKQIFIFGLPLIFLTVIFAWGTSSTFVKKLSQLTRSAQNIAGGNLSDAITITGGREIDDLSQSLDIMREKLRLSMERLEGWARELESKVEDRTGELKDSRDYLHTIIDSLDDELMVLDRELRVKRVNRRLIERVGVKEEELLGKLCYQVSAKRGLVGGEVCDCPVQEVLESGTPRRVVHTRPGEDGTQIYTQIVLSPVKDEGGRTVEVIELARDITEEKRLQEEVLRRNRELSILNETASVISQTLKLNFILTSTMDRVMGISEADIGIICLRGKESGEMRLALAMGLSEEGGAQVLVELLRKAMGSRVEAMERDSFLIDGASAPDPELSAFLSREGLTSLLLIPLALRGEALGFFCMGTRRPRAFPEEGISLIGAVARQTAVAIENATLYEELQRKEEMRGELLHKVITAQEEERKRIARELHDETSQSLAALGVALEAASIEASRTSISEQVERLKGLAFTTLEGVHRLIFNLRPTVLDDLGLESAMRWLVEKQLLPAGINVSFNSAGLKGRLPSQVETSVFRVVQEAISNILRHSGAENVTIDCEYKDGSLKVSVEDDGRGFDAESLSDASQGRMALGLHGMKERITLLQGNIEVISRLGSGTQINLEVPISAEGNGDV